MYFFSWPKMYFFYFNALFLWLSIYEKNLNEKTCYLHWVDNDPPGRQ